MRISRIILVAASLLLAPLVCGADFQKGLDAYNSADYETALAEWQVLAEAGDIGSQFGLGQMYGNGFGVMMDDAAAIKWYGLAAGQGHARAQCNLAVMHQNGWGLPQNDVEAMRLFGLAADQGVTEAIIALGRFYAMDFAEDYDPIQAYKWFSLAVLLGDIDAGAKRDMIFEKMSAEQVAAGDALVAAWSGSHAGLLASD